MLNQAWHKRDYAVIREFRKLARYDLLTSRHVASFREVNGKSVTECPEDKTSASTTSLREVCGRRRWER